MDFSSLPGVSTCCPRLPMTMAVPVSWHIGRTPAAAILAFFSRSSATNLSLFGRFGIVEDARELRQVIRAQVMRDVVQRRFGQQAHRFRLDLQEGAAVRSLDCRHPFGGEQSVLGGVITDRQQVLIEEVGHHLS